MMFKVSYKNYLLTLLVMVGVVTSFERFIFALALEPIKHELQLSDSQLGLMTGIAFAAFYAIAGIPIARWADRGNRATITALAVGLLGVMVSVCGMATSFFQLLLVRAGVAVGEAGIVPAAQSLLSDYFKRAERPQAMAIYMSFYTISTIVGYLLGGQLIDLYGWRTTFILMGAPGILMAIIVKFTIKEPRLNRPKIETSHLPSLTGTARVLWRQRTFRQILCAFCVGYFFNMGISQWLAVFLMRSHGMTALEVGGWLALSYGVFGTLGNYLGGYYASRFAAYKEKLQMRTLVFTTVCYALVSIMVYLSINKYAAITFIAVKTLIGAFSNGPIFAAMQSLVHEKMRSVAVAVAFMLANLIGFGLGPLALGVLSDLLHPMFGQDSLRYALVIFSPGSLWVAFYLWKVSNTIEEDIKNTEAEADAKKSSINASNIETADSY